VVLRVVADNSGCDDDQEGAMAPACPPEDVLDLITSLILRPGRKDRRLPLIWLSDREHGTGIVHALEERLGTRHRYLVPCAREEAASEDANNSIRELLKNLCARLAEPRFGLQPLRFRHYELAVWLMQQDLSEFGPEERRERIATLLRGRHRPFRGHDNERGNNVLDLGPQYRLPIWLIRRVVPEVIFRAAVSGRIPGFGRRYRWFMRQQYLAPLQSVNFLGFADRLTQRVRQPEDAEQVDKLLVHAFLQDLRRAYRRGSRRMEGWQRTVYPVVLIDNATGNSNGRRLLQLVNDVRNETGQRDPLLVVCSSDDDVPQPPAQAIGLQVEDPDSDERRHGDPAYNNAIYKRWADALPGSRRARVDTAWYMPIRVSNANGADSIPRKPFVAPRPPLLARAGVVAVLLVIVIVATGAFVYTTYADGPGCQHVPFVAQVNLRSIDGQCIGYSDSSHFRFNDEPGQERLRYIQDKIFEQNKIARDRWEQGGRTRPYVTIVYLGILTGREATEDEEAYSGEREELEGLAVAQHRGITESATASDPLLNVVIANAGQQMKYVDQVVDMIEDLAAKDPTVVGVIGLDESRDTTAAALQRLNTIGLPVIATTLSADYLDKNSRLYLQLAPPNREQAMMMAEYAKQVLRVSQARVYWTTGVQSSVEKDLYVQTLVDDLKLAFPALGINVDYSGEFNGSLTEACGYPGMVVFAGRWSEFPLFLKTLDSECGLNRPLHLIADDSVNRYMANPKLRENAPSTIPVTYASKSTPATCERLQDAQVRGESSADLFFRLIQKPGLLDPQRCAQGAQGNEPVAIGERAPLAYDSAMLLLRAVEDLSLDLRRTSSWDWDPRSIVPVAVHVKIRELVHERPFDGVAGVVQFVSGSGEPVRKRISLLHVTDVSNTKAQPVEVFHCGRAQPNDDPACRQPFPVVAQPPN
jgi:hypothetical protein